MREKILHQWLRLPYSLNVHTVRKGVKTDATVLFIHGIGHSGAAWNNVIASLPDTIQCISIDLLGFGESPQPSWLSYSAKVQARSVLATLLRLRLSRPVIIVGHSLGALVAIEIAKRYPLAVKSLILCSPPFYRANTTLPTKDKFLIDLYSELQKHPERIISLTNTAKRFRFIKDTFSVNDTTITSYINALEASIINQTSMNDAKKIKTPATIIYGRLDPVVILKNIQNIAKVNKKVTTKTIVAGHDVQGKTYIKAVIDAILNASVKKPS